MNIEIELVFNCLPTVVTSEANKISKAFREASLIHLTTLDEQIIILNDENKSPQGSFDYIK